jgi:hypothetical protein
MPKVSRNLFFFARENNQSLLSRFVVVVHITSPDVKPHSYFSRSMFQEISIVVPTIYINIKTVIPPASDEPSLGLKGTKYIAL